MTHDLAATLDALGPTGALWLLAGPGLLAVAIFALTWAVIRGNRCTHDDAPPTPPFVLPSGWTIRGPGPSTTLIWVDPRAARMPAITGGTTNAPRRTTTFTLVRVRPAGVTA